MSHSAEILATRDGADAPLLESLLPLCRAATDQVTAYAAAAGAPSTRVSRRPASHAPSSSKPSSTPPTASPGSRPMKQPETIAGLGRGFAGTGGLSELDALLLQLGFAEYLNQLAGGLPVAKAKWSRAIWT